MNAINYLKRYFRFLSIIKSNVTEVYFLELFEEENFFIVALYCNLINHRYILRIYSIHFTQKDNVNNSAIKSNYQIDSFKRPHSITIVEVNLYLIIIHLRGVGRRRMQLINTNAIKCHYEKCQMLRINSK